MSSTMGVLRLTKIARATCVICHEIKPRTEMRQMEVSENTGSSLGVSKNPRRQDYIRVSVRSYWAHRKKWVCSACWGSRPHYLSTLLSAIFLNPIFVPKHRGMGPAGQIIYTGTLGYFGLGWIFTILIAAFASLADGRGLPNTRL